MILPTLHREGSNRRALDVWATLNMVMAEHHFCIWLLVPCYCTALVVGLNITEHIMNCPWAALTIYIPWPPPLRLAVLVGTLYINYLLGRSAVTASYVRDPPAANQAVMPGLKLQICVCLAEFLADLICTVSVHIGVMECQQRACLLILGMTALAPGAGRLSLVCLLSVTHVNVIDMVISIVTSSATDSRAAWVAIRVGF